MKLPRLNQSGIAHILAPLLFVVLFAAVGGYVLLKSHAAPVQSNTSTTDSSSSKVSDSLVIAPGDWPTLKDASIVTDAPKGKVVKISPYVSGSNPDGHRAISIGARTKIHPNGIPLAALHKFITSHFGHPATICFTARASRANSMIALDGPGLSNNYFNRHPYFGRSYDKKCYDFTIISRSNYEKNINAVNTEWLQVLPGTSGYTSYLDNVIISLR